MDNVEKAYRLAPVLRMIYSDIVKCKTISGAAGAIVAYMGDMRLENALQISLNDASDITSIADDIKRVLQNFKDANGIWPSTIYIDGVGLFSCDKCSSDNPSSRLFGKIALITGGAQGFGRGIAEELAAQGAYVAVADLNYDGALKCANELALAYGAGHAIAIKANVAEEESVAAMVRDTVLAYGGLDLYISNAGVLIAGALPDMKKEQFDLVTSVNYTGYFLGVKHASAPMKIQRSIDGAYSADIIEINSKSGLEGSNKNFAYAGSKFGGVGLTQSFALELVEYGIKVNAICPGNFLDGPLWSDPEKGLFRQYFDAGKVPGAKSVEDVQRYYESRVPMKRGCTVKDVARAIFYLVEQQYETGQALPVTGGQVMLN